VPTDRGARDRRPPRQKNQRRTDTELLCKAISDDNDDVLSARRYCSKPSPSGRLSTSVDSESRLPVSAYLSPFHCELTNTYATDTAPQARTERPPRAASRVGLRSRQEGLGGERVPVGALARTPRAQEGVQGDARHGTDRPLPHRGVDLPALVQRFRCFVGDIGGLQSATLPWQGTRAR
jgi:hypothetical protein